MSLFHPRTRFDSYLEGELDEDTQRRVADHLHHCPMCQDEVDQRQRIMQASVSRHDDDTLTARRGAPVDHEHTVLGGRPGVPGWKVVLALGAGGIAAAAVVLAAWVAGEPDASAEASEPPSLAPVVEAEPSETAAAAGSDSSASSDEQSSTDGLFQNLAASTLGQSAVDTSSPAETLTVLEELRRHGWNVPSLSVVGLTPQSVGVREHTDATEMVLTLSGAQGSATLEECRPTAVALADSTCATLVEDAEVNGDSADTTTREASLPMGVTATILEHEDGSWSAEMQTAQATYAFSTDLPVERADRVMGLVVLAERARVQSAQLPDSPSDRIVRGFERLMPWSQASAEAR